MEIFREVKSLGHNKIIFLRNEIIDIFNLKFGDVLDLSDIKVHTRAYKCNKCKKGICNLDTTLDTHSMLEMTCSSCGHVQLWPDSITYEEWLKDRRKK